LPDGRTAVAEPLGEALLLRPPAAHGPPGGRARGRPAAGGGPGRIEAGAGPRLALSFLGEGRPHAHVDGRPVPLTPRHAEILAVLALHRRALTGDGLALCLYGEDGSPASARPETHGLRQQLGDVVRARPYRLGCAVE